MISGLNNLFAEKVCWDSIVKDLIKDPLQFEDCLLKIHFKRQKQLSEVERGRIIKFLYLGYCETKDVRYFNELLWFFGNGQEKNEFLISAKEKYYSNLDENKCHRIPSHWDVSEIEKAKGVYSDNEVNIKPMRICLIGFPPFFGRITRSLRKDGHFVQQYFLPYHKKQHISYLLKLGIAVKFWSYISGNFYSYKTLKLSPKDEELGNIIRAGNFDIGFHKLNFIIKENIFGAFKMGLLNDHWGLLPLMRGRSTIAYSLLLRVPVISTIHLVTSGIDEGPIVNFYPLDISGTRNLNQIRNKARQTMPERIISSIKQAGSKEFRLMENPKQQGYTFYEMHPWITKHVSEHILTKMYQS